MAVIGKATAVGLLLPISFVARSVGFHHAVAESKADTAMHG